MPPFCRCRAIEYHSLAKPSVLFLFTVVGVIAPDQKRSADMSISVAVPVNKSARVRALKANHPYMTPEDIAATTGMRLDLVNAALSKGDCGRNRSPD